jgi:predicted CDP-diglyceride synthetase/phosphatidate cytidylyltransferase
MSSFYAFINHVRNSKKKKKKKKKTNSWWRFVIALPMAVSWPTCCTGTMYWHHPRVVPTFEVLD